MKLSTPNASYAFSFSVTVAGDPNIRFCSSIFGSTRTLPFADRVLLARQPVWPPQRYSVLAGFVEVGESLEACVRREIEEEVGVLVDRVRYLGSQPWPFPRSLMLGFSAVADPSVPLRPADGEIEEARWVHRDTVRAALESETGAVEGLLLPPGVSIAYRMLRGWAQHERPPLG